MDGQPAKSLNADLNALRKELGELHQWARSASGQPKDQRGTDDGAIIMRGK
ncbi:MAG: hypothetical protein KJ000_04990 [Pirellulaceae bacterium]|jgi:hypothetical protein|nr:hypothetical protein [Pirellulaceae bacterium]